MGAILGTVIGRRRGAAIGTFLGGAAGTGVQALTKPPTAELPAESTLAPLLSAAPELPKEEKEARICIPVVCLRYRRNRVAGGSSAGGVGVLRNWRGLQMENEP